MIHAVEQTIGRRAEAVRVCYTNLYLFLYHNDLLEFIAARLRIGAFVAEC